MDSTREWLRNVLVRYSNADRTFRDTDAALRAYNGIIPKMDTYTHDNGQSAVLLCLHGTLPISFRGVTYNIPVAVWVPSTYPAHPPICFVTPTSNMLVKSSKHVDLSGKIYHPMLASWHTRTDESNLVRLLGILQEIFSLEPPVYSKPQSQSTPTANLNSTTQAYNPSLLSSSLSNPPPTNPSLQQRPLKPTSSLPNSTPPPYGANPTSTHSTHVGSVGYPIIGGGPGGESRQYSMSVSPPTHPSNFAPAIPAKPSNAPGSGSNVSNSTPIIPSSQLNSSPSPSANSSAATRLSSAGATSPPPVPPNPYTNQVSRSSSPGPQTWGVGMNVSPTQSPSTLVSQQQPQQQKTPAAMATNVPTPKDPAATRLEELRFALKDRTMAAEAARRQKSAVEFNRLVAVNASLNEGNERLKDIMKRLKEEEDKVKRNIDILITTNSELRGNTQKLQTEPEVPVDEILSGASVVHKQLIDAMMEEQAIDDTIYTLAQALNTEKIELSVFMKHTRVLARELFMKRALIKKIKEHLNML